MSNFPRNFINALIGFVLIINVFFSAACVDSNSGNANSNDASNRANTNRENANLTKDDVGELLTIIRLPEIPEEAVWREETLPKNNNREGSADRKITAVLKYNTETAAKLVAQIEQNKKPEQVEIGAESWFPEELTAQTQISGNESLKGIAYGANDFVNIPYGSGRIVRVEGTDYFVLELFAD